MIYKNIQWKVKHGEPEGNTSTNIYHATVNDTKRIMVQVRYTEKGPRYSIGNFDVADETYETEQELIDAMNGKINEDELKRISFDFAEFITTYRRIESQNVRHDQFKNHGGQIYSWIGASNDKIWKAYKKGEQLKHHWEL